MSEKDEVDRVVAEKHSNATNGGVVAPEHHPQQEIAQSPPTRSTEDANDGATRATSKSQWVKFDDPDDADRKSDENTTPHPLAAPRPAAVLTTETVHVNVSTSSSPTRASGQERNHQTAKLPSVAVIEVPSSRTTTDANSGMRTIELSTGRVREGFANGDIIVTLLPVNTKWPWVTPAIFRPELVPEELMAQGLTLTVEEYVHAMETLVNDYRFTFYNICYKRVLVCWIVFAFAVLLGLLFSGLTGITLFVLGVAWLFLNAAAIFLCMWIKLRLSRGLEKCLALVNKQLLRHKILLALDDRGKISCHKVNLCFLYFDSSQCVTYLNDFIARNEQSGNAVPPGWESRMDLGASDIVIQGSTTTRVSRKQERATLLYLRYASRWGNEAVRGHIDVSMVEPARHCATWQCPCQYIEQHLSCKPRGDNRSCWLTICYDVNSRERRIVA
ncbi:transmembrane protein 268 isoform X2 [Lutzomyia longipalpis]|uniref:transmembrane protein 268 isoform X2 n=1 Tax=Lutzomyia longipalpis TaxID=7200 RepID=UPI002483B643|nr:transmembrane protein 268 isoform X2 [Lutzomyia longipalpis]